MIKKQLSFLAVILISTAAMAQPVLDKLYDFQPGASYTYKTLATGVNIDTATIATVGQNVNWDFSSYNLDNAVNTDSIKTLASSSFPAQFAGASYVFKEHSGIQQYYRKSGDTILYMGNDYGGNANTYNPYAVTIILPGTYGTSANNNYGPMSVNAAGSMWSYHGRYNAYGALKLPGGAVHQNVGLYLVIGGDAWQTYSDYMWARAGDAQPLLRIQFKHSGGTTQVYHSYFPTSALVPTGVGQVASAAAALVVYPNPVKDVLQFKGIENPLSITITDMTGRKMEGINYRSGSASIDVNALSSGLYVLSVTTATGRVSKLFRVEG